MPGKLKMIGGGRYLSKAGQHSLPPAGGLGTQASHTILDEIANEIWKPPFSVDGPRDTRAPLPNAEPRVPGYPTAGPGMAVQI